MKNNTKLLKIREAIAFYSKIKFAKIRRNENILIFGISRGGTTILAEALVTLFNARLVWEPLFPHREVFLKRLNPYSTHRYSAFNLGWNPYVSKAHEKEVDHYFERLFVLKERNIRLYRFSNYKEFSSQKHTVFKFCFGNFMYPYFSRKFQFKSIILLRHPFAIAASSLNFGDNYDWHKKNYNEWKYIDTPFSDGFFSQLNENVSLVTSAFTLLVYQAVSQFSFVLKHLNTENTMVVFYEDLVVDQEKVFKLLEAFFERNLNLDVFKLAISKQSFSSKAGHTHLDKIAQLSKWKLKCSDKDREQGLRIFEAFDFDVYSDDIFPTKELIK